VNADDGAVKLLFQPLERQAKRGLAADQHVIMTLRERKGGLKPDGLLEPSPGTIADNGATDLAGQREADPRGCVLIRSGIHLNGEGLSVEPTPFGDAEKVAAALQSTGLNGLVSLRHPSSPTPRMRLARPQAERRLRPRARRAAITLRPPTVAMRARKP
jgi:hypothetical protein